MHCGHCGSQSAGGERFCANCGAALARAPAAVTARPAAPAGYAVAAMVVGIIGLMMSCLPACGLPLAVGAIALSVPGARSDSPGMALAGRIMGAIGCLIAASAAGMWIYLASTGQFRAVPAVPVNP